MSLSINESIDVNFKCKGKWIRIEHYVIPNKPMKKNEKHRYCSICWENDFKEGNFGAHQEQSYRRPYRDSKINNKSGPCGNDTL